MRQVIALFALALAAVMSPASFARADGQDLGGEEATVGGGDRMPRLHPAAATAGRRLGRRGGGFSLVELVIVLGVLTLLLALLLTALGRARESARAGLCANNLRQIGSALHGYADDNHGWIPRDHWLHDFDRPYWGHLLAPHLGYEISEASPPVLQCPSHPLGGEVFNCYLMNAFSFDGPPPPWRATGPTRLARVRNAAEAIWVAEGADFYRDPFVPGSNRIYFNAAHDVHVPEHLPGGEAERISDDRHLGRGNLLFFDSSVRPVRRGELRLRMFDDGIRPNPTLRP